MGVGKHPELNKVTPRSLARKVAMARNMAATYGGRSLVELAFGRRPRDVTSVEGQYLEQLTSPGDRGDRTSESLQSIATRVYLEARQREDIHRGPFSQGDLVYYWHTDPLQTQARHTTWPVGQRPYQQPDWCHLHLGHRHRYSAS